jgi:hypothetical protein
VTDNPAPIREVANQPDPLDSARVRLVEERWAAQDMAYETIERTIEEHIRMLSGRQWDVWSDLVQGFVDPTRYMSDDERRWRQRPVMDFLGYWYMVTLSKVTENQPLVGFLPNNADEHSAMLAEVMDPIFKTLWDEAEMSDRLMQVASWCLAGGEAYLVSRVDFRNGETRELTGPAVVPYQAEGSDEPAIDVMIEDAPYDESGNPLVDVSQDEMGEYSFEPTGDPFLSTKGTVRVDVASPLEIRAQWGSHIPWNEKAWVMHRWFLLPSEVEATYGMEVEANVKPISSETTPGTLERMLFGAGYFGAARGDSAAQNPSANDDLVREYVCGYTMWEKPCPEYPDGRLLVIAGDTVLHDSARPFKLECAGPIRRVQFMPLPGRPIGSTPLEKMVPLQKRYNRIEAQVAEHTNLCTNPVLMVSDSAGIDSEGFTARPGQVITHSAPSGVKPGEWLSPPSLGIDVWKHKNDVRDHLFTIGSITGNEGANPAADASGELIQQLRFNADRPLSPLTRSLEYAAAGVAEDWLAILPTVWDDETTIHYAGEDNIIKAATVLPEMWEGSVSARPVMESAAPESREKRQERVFALFQMGAFGNLADPIQNQQAIKKLLDLSRFPELTRASKPGGKHRMMAEHNLGKLLRNVDPMSLPILPMYDLTVHLAVFDDYMSGPDYLNVDPNVMESIMAFYEQMKSAMQAQQATMMLEQSDMQMASQAAGLLPSPDTSAPPSESGRETKGIPDEQRFTPPDLP